jgi:hypothetical protein
MEVLKCRVIQTFRAPKKVNGGKSLIYKLIKEGSIIEGSYYNQSSSPANYVPVIKTTEGFIVPESHINIIAKVGTSKPKDFQEAKVVEDVDLLSGEQKSNIKKVTESFSKNFAISAKNESKTTVNGAMIGAGIGLIYALMKGQNKLVYSGIGGLIGGYIGKAYHKKQSV